MLSRRFSALVHAAIASGALIASGCVSRPLLDGSGADGSGSGTDGDPSGGDPSGGDPSGGDPSGGDPSGGDPSGGDPSGGDPSGGDPTGGDPAGPPELIDADFLDANTLQLTFSEPIANAADVDTSKFRMSIAFGGTEYYAYGTYYFDLGYWGYSEEYCYEYCPYWSEYCYEYCYPGPYDQISVSNINNVSGDSIRVNLTLDPPVDRNTCDNLDEILREGYYKGGIFVHYSNNSAPQITDLDGNPLAAIAEHWVLTPTKRQDSIPGLFSAMDPYIPIPCPF